MSQIQQNNILGIVTTPTTKIGDEPNCLYYGDGKLTDTFYITTAKTQGNKCWVYGKVRAGDYLCTSLWYGVAIKAPNRNVAFGIALESCNGFCENESEYINLIEFKYLGV